MMLWSVPSKEYGQAAEREGYLKRLIIKWRKSGAVQIVCFSASFFVHALRYPFFYGTLGKPNLFESTGLPPSTRAYRNWPVS